MSVARYYRPDKNVEQAEFPGVPLRDIEQDEWNVIPAWLQASIDASDIYQKTKPDTTPRKRTDEEA